jgi:hypothetical protein
LKEKVEKTAKNIRKFQIIGMGQMEQRSVVLFLRFKGLSKNAIHHELVTVLQENAVSYSSVTRFCKKAILSLNSEEASSLPKDDGLDEVNEAILLALSDEPCSCVRRMAGGICVPKALYIVGLSILCISRSDIRSLHRVPHKLSDNEKTRQVELSIQLRDILLFIWHQGLDGDTYSCLTSESWFCLSTDQVMR